MQVRRAGGRACYVLCFWLAPPTLAPNANHCTIWRNAGGIPRKCIYHTCLCQEDVTVIVLVWWMFWNCRVTWRNVVTLCSEAKLACIELKSKSGVWMCGTELSWPNKEITYAGLVSTFWGGKKGTLKAEIYPFEFNVIISKSLGKPNNLRVA